MSPPCALPPLPSHPCSRPQAGEADRDDQRVRSHVCGRPRAGAPPAPPGRGSTAWPSGIWPSTAAIGVCCSAAARGGMHAQRARCSVPLALSGANWRAHYVVVPPPCCSRPPLQVSNRLKERGFEDNQMMYRVACYTAKVGAWGVHLLGGRPAACRLAGGKAWHLPITLPRCRRLPQVTLECLHEMFQSAKHTMNWLRWGRGGAQGSFDIAASVPNRPLRMHTRGSAPCVALTGPAPLTPTPSLAQRVRAPHRQGGALCDVDHAAGPAGGAAVPAQGPPARAHAAAGG